MKLKLLTGSIGLIAASAFAVVNAGSAADYFNKIDADASGMITEAEFVAYKTAGGKYTAEQAGEKFAKLAGDDGQITLAELEGAMKKAKTEKHEKKMDRSS